MAAAEYFLAVNGHDILATDEELESLTFSVARGEVEVEALAIWLRQRLRAE